MFKKIAYITFNIFALVTAAHLATCGHNLHNRQQTATTWATAVSNIWPNVCATTNFAKLLLPSRLLHHCIRLRHCHAETSHLAVETHNRNNNPVTSCRCAEGRRTKEDTYRARRYWEEVSNEDHRFVEWIEMYARSWWRQKGREVILGVGVK